MCETHVLQNTKVTVASTCELTHYACKRQLHCVRSAVYVAYAAQRQTVQHSVQCRLAYPRYIVTVCSTCSKHPKCSCTGFQILHRTD